jgi:hypothetical protein
MPPALFATLIALAAIDVTSSLNVLCNGVAGTADPGCTTSLCAACCEGDGCAANCTATECGRYCEGFQCGVGCVGTRCAKLCFGEE